MNLEIFYQNILSKYIVEIFYRNKGGKIPEINIRTLSVPYGFFTEQCMQIVPLQVEPNESSKVKFYF